MLCPSCGASVGEVDAFCAECGSRQTRWAGPNVPSEGARTVGVEDVPVSPSPATASAPEYPVLCALVGGAAIVTGALGPWLTASELFATVSLHGTETTDGKTALVCGAAGAALVVAAAARCSRGSAVLAAFLFVLVGFTGLYQYAGLNERVASVVANDAVSHARIGWGIYVLLLGAAFGLGGSIALTRSLPTPVRTPWLAPVRAWVALLWPIIHAVGAARSALSLPITHAVAAAATMVVAIVIFVRVLFAAWIRDAPTGGLGFWLGVAGGLAAWAWTTRWVWRQSGPKWAAAFFFGSVAAIAAYVLHQRRALAEAKGQAFAKFPTRRLALALVAVSGVAIVAARLADHETTVLTINGLGMAPAIPDQGMVVVHLGMDEGDGAQRGDIVYFDDPGTEFGRQVKRVVGLVGERLTVEGGEVVVDGQTLPESYVEGPTRCTADEDCDLLIPSGHVYVLGDNRSNSRDSRVIGPVPAEGIVGRVDRVIWPPDEVRVLQTVSYP